MDRKAYRSSQKNKIKKKVKEIPCVHSVETNANDLGYRGILKHRKPGSSKE